MQSVSWYRTRIFAEAITAGLTDLTPLAEKESRFAANPTEAGAKSLARINDTRGQYVEAAAFYRKAADISGTPGAYVMDIFWAESSAQREGKSTPEAVTAAAEAVVAAQAPAEDVSAVATQMPNRSGSTAASDGYTADGSPSALPRKRWYASVTS